MRELTVYYCPKCGQYGYYQLPQNAVCPNCHETMVPLPMTYQSFMNLEFDIRDRLIAGQIAGDIIPRSSVVQRISELEKDCNMRHIVSEFKSRLEELGDLNNGLSAENEVLRKKNAELEYTVEWMHELIWDLSRQAREKHE